MKKKISEEKKEIKITEEKKELNKNIEIKPEENIKKN